MAMIARAYERMDDRLAAFVTALTAALPARVVKTELLHFDAQPSADLTAGVVTVISDYEADYSTRPGMAGREGTQRLILVGHLKVAETDTATAIQALEMDMMEEIKTFVRNGVPRMTLNLERCQGSRQLDHPYGWFVALIDAGPPVETTR